MRLLGVYFCAWGIIDVVREVVRLALAFNKLAPDSIFPERLTTFAYIAAILWVGGYLLFGGQWVFQRLLVPIPRSCETDALDVDDCQR